MPLIFDKIYTPLLLTGLILLMKMTPWFYDIALGGTDRIIAMAATALFAIIKFIIRFVKSSFFVRQRKHSVQYS